MWKNGLFDTYLRHDPVTVLVAAALLFNISGKRLVDRESEIEPHLYSETLAWIIVHVLWRFSVVRRNPADPQADLFKWAKPPLSNVSLWLVSIGLLIHCLFAAEDKFSTIFPALSPLILLAHRLLGIYAQPATLSRGPVSLAFSLLTNTLCGTTFVAAFAIIALKAPLFLTFGSSEALFSVPLVAQLVVYATIALLGQGAESPHKTPQHLGIESAVLPLSLCIIRLMIISISFMGAAFGFPQCQLERMLALGLSKALFWYFAFKMSRHCSWRTAASIGIYSIISTQDPFRQSSAERALVHVIVSFVSLGQLIYTLPEKARARSFLWLFFLVPLTPYFSTNLKIRAAQSSLQMKNPAEHPIQILIRDAQTDFENMLQTQSKNYTAAHEEYQRRYKLDPPPGFDAWYAFAEFHQSLIIDEFDLIHQALSPLLSLSGQEIRDAIDFVQNLPGSELWSCDFSGREATVYCTHTHRAFDRHIGSMFNMLFRNLSGSLPDVKVLVNHIDEPRVIYPIEGSVNDNGRSILNDMSRRPVWDTLTRYCDSEKSNRTSIRFPIMAEKDFPLPFITDPVSAANLCQHPEYRDMHGLLMSPISFRLLEGLIPVLSTGSLSTMGDILYPSAAYMEPEFLYEEAYDVEWDKKRNSLYWAGSTTGGFAQDNSWRHYHRQRFVELAQNIQKQKYAYLREEGGVLRRITMSFLNSRLFDVAFTRVFQCETRRCKDQRAYFKVKPWEEANRAFQSRLVFDMDGNGISGRFYKLLASRSLPLKQTLLREWHDERLVPWIHYVPVSQGLEELPELVSHLTLTKAGQDGARLIAEQGRAWHAQAFREVDRTIYMYRLMLELARLQDPNRQPQHGSI